jgi:hypothetical protein
MAKKKRVRFEAELIEGHKGVTAAIVPFDPEEKFGAPVRLFQRRHGWLVRGTLQGKPFTGYIGDRWGRFFVMVDEEARADLDLDVGDELSFELEPTTDAEVWDRAVQLSKKTTQPKKARADAVTR